MFLLCPQLLCGGGALSTMRICPPPAPSPPAQWCRQNQLEQTAFVEDRDGGLALSPRPMRFRPLWRSNWRFAILSVLLDFFEFSVGRSSNLKGDSPLPPAAGRRLGVAGVGAVWEGGHRRHPRCGRPAVQGPRRSSICRGGLQPLACRLKLNQQTNKWPNRS